MEYLAVYATGKTYVEDQPIPVKIAAPLALQHAAWHFKWPDLLFTIKTRFFRYSSEVSEFQEIVDPVLLDHRGKQQHGTGGSKLDAQVMFPPGVMFHALELNGIKSLKLHAPVPRTL